MSEDTVKKKNVKNFLMPRFITFSKIATDSQFWPAEFSDKTIWNQKQRKLVFQNENRTCLMIEPWQGMIGGLNSWA